MKTPLVKKTTGHLSNKKFSNKISLPHVGDVSSPAREANTLKTTLEAPKFVQWNMGTVELIVSKRCWKFSQAGGFKHVLYLPLFGANVSIWLCLTNIFEMGWSPVVSFQPRDSLGKMNYDESIFDEHSFSFWLAWNQQRAQKNGARDASNYFPKYPNLPSQALQSLTFFGKVVGLVGQSWTQLVRHGTSSDHRNHNETTFRQVRQGQCEKLTAERDALEVSDFQKQRLVMVNVFFWQPDL